MSFPSPPRLIDVRRVRVRSKRHGKRDTLTIRSGQEFWLQERKEGSKERRGEMSGGECHSHIFCLFFEGHIQRPKNSIVIQIHTPYFSPRLHLMLFVSILTFPP